MSGSPAPHGPPNGGPGRVTAETPSLSPAFAFTAASPPPPAPQFGAASAPSPAQLPAPAFAFTAASPPPPAPQFGAASAPSPAQLPAPAFAFTAASPPPPAPQFGAAAAPSPSKLPAPAFEVPSPGPRFGSPAEPPAPEVPPPGQSPPGQSPPGQSPPGQSPPGQRPPRPTNPTPPGDPPQPDPDLLDAALRPQGDILFGVTRSELRAAPSAARLTKATAVRLSTALPEGAHELCVSLSGALVAVDTAGDGVAAFDALTLAPRFAQADAHCPLWLADDRLFVVQQPELAVLSAQGEPLATRASTGAGHYAARPDGQRVAHWARDGFVTVFSPALEVVAGLDTGRFYVERVLWPRADADELLCVEAGDDCVRTVRLEPGDGGGALVEPAGVSDIRLCGPGGRVVMSLVEGCALALLARDRHCWSRLGDVPPVTGELVGGSGGLVLTSSGYLWVAAAPAPAAPTPAAQPQDFAVTPLRRRHRRRPRASGGGSSSGADFTFTPPPSAGATEPLPAAAPAAQLGSHSAVHFVAVFPLLRPGEALCLAATCREAQAQARAMQLPGFALLDAFIADTEPDRAGAGASWLWVNPRSDPVRWFAHEEAVACFERCPSVLPRCAECELYFPHAPADEEPDTCLACDDEWLDDEDARELFGLSAEELRLAPRRGGGPQGGIHTEDAARAQAAKWGSVDALVAHRLREQRESDAALRAAGLDPVAERRAAAEAAAESSDSFSESESDGADWDSDDEPFCAVCGRDGHMAHQCGRFGGFDGICYSCGEYGHRAADCDLGRDLDFGFGGDYDSGSDWGY